jgi:hypothetical protein
LWPLFLAVLFFQLLFASGHLYSYDEVTLLKTATSLVERQELAVDLPDTARLYAKPGRDGRLYSKFGIGMSAYLAPWYFGGRTLGRLVGADEPETFGEIIASFANAPLIALIAILFLLTCGDLGLDRRVSFLTTLLLVFATSLPVYGRGLFNDALTAVLVLAAFRAWLGERPIASGACAALAVLTRAEYAVLIPVLLFFFRSRAAEERPPWRWRHGFASCSRARLHLLAVPLLLGLLVLIYNAARFGSPFDQGTLTDNPHDVFSTPLMTGLYGILLSPGKGVFWYAPPLFLSLLGIPWMTRASSIDRVSPRRTVWLILAIFLPILLIHASWHSWMGGWSYGPRRLIAILPLLLLPAGFWIAAHRENARARLAVRVCLVAGIVMQAGGLVVNFMRYIPAARGPVLWSFAHGNAFGQIRFLMATGQPDLWYLHLFGPSVAALFIPTVLFLAFAAALHIAFRNVRMASS